jgi:hypothetical protein
MKVGLIEFDLWLEIVLAAKQKLNQSVAAGGRQSPHWEMSLNFESEQ